MNEKTVQAFFDELEKISRAQEATELGKLVNADKEQFPTSDTGGGHLAKRQHRTFAYPTTSTSAPDPEDKTPEGTNEGGGFTY